MRDAVDAQARRVGEGKQGESTVPSSATVTRFSGVTLILRSMRCLRVMLVTPAFPWLAWLHLRLVVS
ncbi:hypothetical protein FOA52_015340 [Chlamydomonas sp. UWO 241]|nr:hypothetical protein FOA52_015340 [Chlamydomonas sp. UWO 241]